MRSGADYVLGQEDGKKRCLKYVNDLRRHFLWQFLIQTALRIRDHLSFFKAVRNYIIKVSGDPDC